MSVKFFRVNISNAAVLIGILILFSMLAPWLPLADSVGHFRLYLTAFLLLAAFLLACFRDWRKAALATAVSAVGVYGMAAAFPNFDSRKTAGDVAEITAVQLNLSFRNTTPEAVAAFVRAEHADVVALQEVTNKTGRVLELLVKDYPFQVSCRFKGAGGVAVLSRLPKASGVAQGCVEGQGMAWLRVVAGGRAVSVASLHLHWPYPFKQGRQIDRLEKHLKDIPRPVILAGDFNAAPWSQAVNRIATATETAIAGGLRLSFDIRVNSWAPPIAMPIDHVLLPEGIVALDVRLGPGPGSDHRSIIAKLALPESSSSAHVSAQPRAETRVVN